MQTTQQRRLRVVLDVHQYRLSRAEEEALFTSLDGLRPQVENFPVADVHVLIEGNPRSNDVSVKLTLVLPGVTLVVSDHDAVARTAFERCLNSLENSLHAYKDRLNQVSERQKTEKGTHQELHAPAAIDAEALASAAESGDYTAFRAATFPIDEGLRKRVGRWVRRHPKLEARLGHGVEIEDIVEDVFLHAFENYLDRNKEVPFGDWLEGLIDPAIKAIQVYGDRELENIQMAQAARSVGERPSAD